MWLSGLFTLHNYVIYIDFYVTSNLLHENSHRQLLVGCASIFETKGHHSVTVGAKVDDKLGLDLIFKLHLDLIIA